ncbi:MAG: translocation/assembly module TamB domain-containing protein [Spirochaetales bacterium]|nr:translocation/assembly module TamB domain-containing protein [Spirochaetales bacterium]
MDKMSENDRKRIKIIIELSFLIPLIIIAFVLYYFIDKEVSKRMVYLKAEILDYMEKQLGREIQYESISPSIFMFLEIRDLKIFSFISQEDEIFRIRRIKIKYNIFTLVFSDNPLTSVSEINISNTLFKFGLSPGQPSERTESQRTILSRLLSTTYKFKVTADNIALILYTDTMLINSTNLFFTINNKGNSYEINLRKGTTRITLNSKDTAPVWFFSRFKIKGSVFSGFNRAELIVRILHLSSNSFVLEKQTFQVVLKDENLSVIKIQDKAPVDVQLAFDFKTSDLVLDFKTENWKPSSMIKFTGPLFSYNPWLNSALTSSGNVTYNLKTDFLKYNLTSSIVLKNPILPPEIVLSTYMYGNKEIVYFKPLVIHSNLGTVDFTGNILFKNFFPEGFLRLANVKALHDKRISADFTLDRYEESLSLKGTRVYIGSSGFDTFNLDVYPRNKALFFNLSTSFAQSKYNDEITAAGEFIIDPQFSLKFDGNLTNIPTSHVYKLFMQDSFFSARIFQFLENLTMNSKFHFSSNFKTAEYYTDNVLIQDHTDNSNYSFFSVKGSEKEAVVDSIQAQWEKFDLSGNVYTRFNEKDTISFLSNFNLEGIPYGITGYYNRDQILSIKGNYGLNAFISFNKANRMTIKADALKLPFPLSGEKEEVAYTSFSISGIFPATGDWQVVSPSMIFYNIPVFCIKENELEVVFTLNKKELFLSEIMYEDTLSELSGLGKIQFGNDENQKTRSFVLLTGKKTEEYYSVSALLDQDTVDARVEFINSPLDRIGKFIVTGSLSGNLEFTGPLRNPEIDGNVSLVKGSVIGDYAGFYADFHIKEPEISFNSFSITYLNLKIDKGKGKYNIEDGQFQFSALFNGEYFAKTIQCSLDFSGSVVTMADESFNRVFEKEYTAGLQVSEIVVDRLPYEPWTLFFTKKDNVLNIDGGPDDAFAGKLFSNGEFEIEVKNPFPIRGFAIGNVTGNTINSEIQWIWIDHEVYNVILGEDVIKFTQGHISGTNIKISGFFNDPDYDGSLIAEDTAISFFLSPIETRPFQCKLFLKEKQIEMEKIAVQIGSGILYTDKGIFFIDHWIPVAYDLTFRTDEYIGLYCVHDFNGVKVDGYTVGTVNTAGDQSTVLVNGNLIVHYGTITLSKPLETEQKENKGAPDLKINVSIESGRKVEFDWPTANFPVLKCYAERGSKIIISYNSALDSFNMNGKIDIRGGEVFYFNRNFYLKSGNIIFNVVNTAEVDPTVSVRAELREFNEEKEAVKIYLIAENNRLSNFSPRFESVPTLSEYDIYRLLGQSLEKRVEESGLGLSFILLSSDVLGETFIFRSFEQTIKELFNLDLFSIRTHVIENILMDRVIGPEEEEEVTENNPASLGTYLDNTTITIGQYIGDDLFISGLVRLKEVDYYTPQTRLGNGLFGIEPEFEISLEWPTPFFNLEWTFNPTQEHLNDLFLYLTDNTIKFEWSFSY